MRFLLWMYSELTCSIRGPPVDTAIIIAFSACRASTHSKSFILPPTSVLYTRDGSVQRRMDACDGCLSWAGRVRPSSPQTALRRQNGVPFRMVAEEACPLIT